MSVKIEDTGILSGFPDTKAVEDKVVPLRVISAREDSVELEIELHYVGFPPEKRNVNIPTSNKTLIEGHLKQIWVELKPRATPLEVLTEVKITE